MAPDITETASKVSELADELLQMAADRDLGRVRSANARLVRILELLDSMANDLHRIIDECRDDEFAADPVQIAKLRAKIKRLLTDRVPLTEAPRE